MNIQIFFQSNKNLETLHSMNLNLPCFIPPCQIAQTAFVYVPFFQSYPHYQFVMPFQNGYQYPQQPEPATYLHYNDSRSEAQILSNQEKQQVNLEISSTVESIEKRNEHSVAEISDSKKIIEIQCKSSSSLKNSVQFDKESKNIQKNYAKAIASFISKNKQLASKLLTSSEADLFIQLTKSIKNQIQNVCHISQYTDNQEFIKAFRILGNYFLKTKSNSYIFNSRIQKKISHLKHRVLISHSLLRC